MHVDAPAVPSRMCLSFFLRAKRARLGRRRDMASLAHPPPPLYSQRAVGMAVGAANGKLQTAEQQAYHVAGHLLLVPLWWAARRWAVLNINARTCGALATLYRGLAAFSRPRLVHCHCHCAFSFPRILELSFLLAVQHARRRAAAPLDDKRRRHHTRPAAISTAAPRPPSTASPMSSSPSWTDQSLPNDRQTLL